MSQVNKKIEGFTFVLLGGLFYGSYGIWSRLMGSSFGDFSQSAIRSVFVILYLLPFAFYHKSFSRIVWRRDYKWLLTLLLASCFISGPLYYAYNHAGVAITTLLSYTGMLIG